ncbi:MAG: DUF1992 domain-containing protein [Gammaproteobacteria bacterium]|nr:DUF1992 domain-containing protein [Gammaproteobacteria bacterium]
MLLIDSLAEEKILAAVRRGEFEDLPGSGKPLVLEQDISIPEELRVGYRLLRNAGCLPPELSLRHEIREVEALLQQAEADVERAAIRRRLQLLRVRLAASGREINLLVEAGAYREKLIQKLTGEIAADIQG